MALNEMTVVESQATAKKIEEKNTVAPYETGYQSMPKSARYDVDVLSQFRANLEQVEELTRRMKFIVGEVNQLIVKKR